MADVPSPYAGLSLWHDQAFGMGDAFAPRPSLPGSLDADVAIVGAGYTGLWTAYALLERDPSMRVVVVEREIAGFGASGRNGGWASAIFPTPWKRIARDSSRDAARRMQLALNESVDVIGATAEREGFDCHFSKGGYLSVARNQAQWVRGQSEVAHAREWGFGEDFLRLLNAAEVADRIGISNALGGTYTPHCAAIQPQLLNRGLAEAVERKGASIFERTPATAVGPRLVRTPHGDVRAEVVVRATEGYTADLQGSERDVVPMYSLMVATEPLPDDVLASIGLEDRATFSDKRHLRIYGQRTADGRIAFGGRGAPYHFGSRVDPSFDHDQHVHDMLRTIVRELFPVLADARFTHAWGGNLGIPRDWFPSVGLDRRSGFAWAGGYVGDGVTTACLAGRTLADLITRTPSDLVTLPWVGRRSRRWEPEPLRWIGVNAVTKLMAHGDRSEASTGKPSQAVQTFWKTLGF
ncbi:MAG TPA: FAD-binding oxidoreductase [Actinomycetes bacterium]|nr:FAD-binding oxidoreductase [Actinomycetes bacterium]